MMTKQINALFNLFEQVLYDAPAGRRKLGLALFKASLAVVLHGDDQVGKAFAQRALEWSNKRRETPELAASDMRIFQMVKRLREQAKQDGRPVPPLTRLDKSNRMGAFQIIADEIGSDPSTVEAAYLRHKDRFKLKS